LFDVHSAGEKVRVFCSRVRFSSLVCVFCDDGTKMVGRMNTNNGEQLMAGLENFGSS